MFCCYSHSLQDNLRLVVCYTAHQNEEYLLRWTDSLTFTGNLTRHHTQHELANRGATQNRSILQTGHSDRLATRCLLSAHKDWQMSLISDATLQTDCISLTRDLKMCDDTTKPKGLCGSQTENESTRDKMTLST